MRESRTVQPNRKNIDEINDERETHTAHRMSRIGAQISIWNVVVCLCVRFPFRYRNSDSFFFVCRLHVFLYVIYSKIVTTKLAHFSCLYWNMYLNGYFSIHFFLSFNDMTKYTFVRAFSFPLIKYQIDGVYWKKWFGFFYIKKKANKLFSICEFSLKIWNRLWCSF